MAFRRVALPLALTLTGCGAGAVHAPAPVPAFAEIAAARWQGVVTYEARHPTLHGASLALEVRPARYVELIARGPGGEPLARARTDALGRFVLDAPVTCRSLVVVAHAVVDGHDVAASPDPLGRTVHQMEVALGAPSAPVVVSATDALPGGPAGAFHIVDTLLRGLETAQAWTGHPLPPLVAYWGRGITTSWSYYHGERPAASGRYAIELMGGDPGRQATSDTDEHDETIILHELGHFVFDRLGTSSSAGGSHPGGTLLDHGLAWEEGRATWFAAAVQGDSHYRDSIGLEPRGRLRVDHDLEQTSPPPRGLGSEASVAEVLWDLADGPPGSPPGSPPDSDHDGVALGSPAVLNAMLDLARTPGSYPCLATFLRALVDSRRVEAAALQAMLLATGQPPRELPPDDVSVWPVDLPTPGRVSGKIDGLTQPAPSGGPPRPDDGFDAVRVYRVHLPVRAHLTARLHIAGTGRAADHSDLDLELRDLRAELVAASRGTTEQEVIARVMEPGWYVLYVRDGGRGDRAGYDLEVRADPIP